MDAVSSILHSLLHGGLSARDTAPIYQHPGLEIGHAFFWYYSLGGASSNRRLPTMQRDPEWRALFEAGNEA